MRTLEAPVEALYDPSSYTFKIEKCSEALKPYNLDYDPECAEVPFEKVFQVWIHAWLVNEPRDIIDDKVSFNVEIGNVCQEDVITLEGLFDNLTYTLSSPGRDLTDSFAIIQDHVECPAQCLLTMPDGSDIPERWGIPMQTQPLIEVMTEDKGLNGASVDLLFKCRSTLSQLGDGGMPPVLTHAFSVSYVDECEVSEIFPALTQDSNVMMFSVSEITYVVPYTQFACNSVENTIVYPPDHPDSAPVFLLSESEPGKIQVISGNRGNLGIYQLMVESCITIFSSKEKRCVVSAEFRVNVVDPCPTS